MKGWNNLHSVRWDANGNGFFVVLVSGRPIFFMWISRETRKYCGNMRHQFCPRYRQTATTWQ